MNKTTSHTIPLEQAVPGMVLAEEVRQKSGGVLLPRSITLSENHLASLLQRDVKEITVEVQSAEPAREALTPEKRRALEKAVKAKVQHMFRRSEMDATMQALQRAVIEYRLENIE